MNKMRAWAPTLHPGHEGKHSRDQRWRVQYINPQTGRQTSKSGFRTKREAEAWRREFLSTPSGKWADPRDARVTFGKLAEEWLDSQHFPKSRTESDLRQMLLRAKRPDALSQTFGAMELGDITYAAVRTWLKTYMSTKSATTVRNNFYALRSVLDYAVDTQHLSDNPARQGQFRKARGVLPSTKRVSDAQEERYALTNVEVRDIIDGLPEPFDMYALLIAFTGLRPGEASGLRIKDVDLNRGTIRVRGVIVGSKREDKPKNDHSVRTIPIMPGFEPRLRQYLTEHQNRAREFFDAHPDAIDPASNLPLFVGVATGRRNGRSELERLDYTKPVQQSVFTRKHWRPACNEADLPSSVVPYDLRHFFISRLVDRLGHDKALTLAVVQRIAGHKSKVMTLDRYSHASRQDLETEGNAMSAAFASVLGFNDDSNVVPFVKRQNPY